MQDALVVVSAAAVVDTKALGYGAGDLICRGEPRGNVIASLPGHIQGRMRAEPQQAQDRYRESTGPRTRGQAAASLPAPWNT